MKIDGKYLNDIREVYDYKDNKESVNVNKSDSQSSNQSLVL